MHVSEVDGRIMRIVPSKITIVNNNNNNNNNVRVAGFPGT